MTKERNIHYDTEKKQFYYVTWFDTGNNDIPTEHPIVSEVQEQLNAQMQYIRLLLGRVQILEDYVDNLKLLSYGV